MQLREITEFNYIDIETLDLIISARQLVKKLGDDSLEQAYKLTVFYTEVLTEVAKSSNNMIRKDMLPPVLLEHLTEELALSGVKVVDIMPEQKIWKLGA